MKVQVKKNGQSQISKIQQFAQQQLDDQSLQHIKGGSADIIIGDDIIQE